FRLRAHPACAPHTPASRPESSDMLAPPHPKSEPASPPHRPFALPAASDRLLPPWPERPMAAVAARRSCPDSRLPTWATIPRQVLPERSRPQPLQESKALLQSVVIS